MDLQLPAFRPKGESMVQVNLRKGIPFRASLLHAGMVSNEAPRNFTDNVILFTDEPLVLE